MVGAGDEGHGGKVICDRVRGASPSFPADIGDGPYVEGPTAVPFRRSAFFGFELAPAA